MAVQQRVLITGGASGIGRAIADCCLEEGARVHICDIDEVALDQAVRDTQGLSGSHCDVGIADRVARLFDDVEDSLGGIDVLVNNAGIGGGDAAIEDIDVKEWRRTMDVNLNSMFYCIQRATPYMKANKSGSIINISTVSVRTGMNNRLPYITSKQGVMGLTHNVARELGPWNVRCNAILPGLIDNERGHAILARKAESEGKSLKETEKEYLKYISMRCWIEAKEVGDLVVFLSSERAKHISGQFIAVDGHMEWEA